MASSVDPSWKSLYKSGGVGFLIVGSLLVINAVADATIYSQLVSYNAKTLGDLLTFALQRSNVYYVQYYSAGGSMLFLLPGMVALYFVLNRKDKGFALIGSALGVLGIVIYLSNLADHLFFIQEAVTYEGGCTSCAGQALYGAAGTFSVQIADILARFTLGVAVIILNLVIYAGRAFPRSIALLGLLAGMVSAGVYPFFALTGGTDLFFYSGIISTILLILWFFAVGAKLYRIIL